MSVTVWLHTCADYVFTVYTNTSGKQRDEQELTQVVLAHYISLLWNADCCIAVD